MSEVFVFEKATKKEARLRLAIDGCSGYGKTYTALSIGTHLAKMRGGEIAFLDTERGSAVKYCDYFDFNVVSMEPPFHPQRFIDAVKSAQKAGFKVIIIDSFSHAWEGEGGALEVKDDTAKRIRGNDFAAWREVTPLQNRLVNTILGADMDVIVTMRSTTEYSTEKDSNGKVTVKKVGMAPVQRKHMEFEFDIVLDMDESHSAIVSKSRCRDLADKVIKKPGEETAQAIWKWLQGAPRTVNPPVIDSPEVAYIPSFTTTSLPATAPRGLVSSDSLALLVGSLKDSGLVTRETAIARVSELAGRPVSSFSHLTQPEFQSVYDALQKERAEALLQT